jgi:hypothetical protein
MTGYLMGTTGSERVLLFRWHCCLLLVLWSFAVPNLGACSSGNTDTPKDQHHTYTQDDAGAQSANAEGEWALAHASASTAHTTQSESAQASITASDVAAASPPDTANGTPVFAPSTSSLRQKSDATRILSVLQIREKSTREIPETATAPVTILKGSDEINAFSIMELGLASDADEIMAKRKESLLIVVDLQKHEETTWNRIQVLQRLSRRLERSSMYSSGHPELLNAGPLSPLYINDAALGESQFLREGDFALWLAFHDVSSDTAFLKDLEQIIDSQRSILGLNLQQIPLLTAGGAIDQYAADDGDRIRITVMGIGYGPRRAQDVDTYGKLHRDMDRDKDESVFFTDVLEAGRSSTLASKRGDELRLAALDLAAGGSAERKAVLERQYKDLDTTEQNLLRHLLNDRTDIYALRIADIVTPEEEIVLDVQKFGVKVDLSPVITMQRRYGDAGTVDSFNPIKTTPSIGSNVYAVYDGRNDLKSVLNWLPGVHLSLLGLGDGSDTEFTLGLVHPILPGLRHHFGLVLAWHDLRDPVWGFTFSPNINFRGLVGAEK